MTNKSKSCLITGITGMVGSHMADYILNNTKWKIHGLCRWRSPLENISHLFKDINNKRITLHYGDLLDQGSLDKVIFQTKPDYIFHLAAQSFPKFSFSNPSLTYDTNIIGTSRLLESIVKNRISPVIHICSSSEVFGRVDKSKIPIDEKCSFHPASPYAISKVGTDLIGRYFYEAYGLKTIITRMFTHTGPRRGDVFAESSFAKQIALIEFGLIKPSINVGNLNSLRTIADVRDAVDAYYKLVTKSKKFGETYNIGGDYTCKVGDLLNYLISISSFKNKISIKIDKERLRPIDADLQVPNVSKFKKNFSWKPKYTFEKTMTDLLNYWRQKVKFLNGSIIR